MLGPQRLLLALAAATLVVAGCASNSQRAATSTQPATSQAPEALDPTPATGASDPAPEPSAPSYVDVVPGALTNKKICNDYRELLTSFEAEAKRRVNGAKGKTDDSWAAASYRKNNQWVRVDQQARLTDSLTQSATQALNEVSDGQAGAVRDLDAYLDDSIDTCGLTQLRSKAQAQVADANRLAETIVSRADDKPWYPKGFNEYYPDDTLAWKWTDESCGYSSGYCWTIRVVSKVGCYDGLYGEINIEDDGVVIDFSNDVVGVLEPRQVALMQFSHFDRGRGSLSGSLNELNCY